MAATGRLDGTTAVVCLFICLFVAAAGVVALVGVVALLGVVAIVVAVVAAVVVGTTVGVHYSLDVGCCLLLL